MIKYLLKKSFFNTVVYARDILQVCLLDRLTPSRMKEANDATIRLRTARFNARSRIRPAQWREIGVCGGPVLLPGPHLYHEGDREFPVRVGDRGYYFALGCVAKMRQPKSAFEFGTFLGLSALTFALNAPDCMIETLDLPDSADVRKLRDKNGGKDRKLVAMAQRRRGQSFRHTVHALRIRQVLADSMEFQFDPGRCYDLIFIDGCHDSPFVENDTAKALNALAPGGILLWDDYIVYHPDVVRCLDRLSRSIKIQTIPGTSIAFHINKTI